MWDLVVVVSDLVLLCKKKSERTYESSRAGMPWMEVWLGTPSMRWNALRFLCRVIWKTEAEPWREAITE